ncbi:MAG: hypothetical protein P4L84_06940, partial [Isosphaeraceae bacterium]|nr:hypothetical protein [Isosphaeraceae bacterium]
GNNVGSAAPPPDHDAAPIADTQLTLRVERAKGQATVIAVAGERLTVVTAAHFLSRNDVDHIVQIQRGEEVVPGHIVAVVRNPSFQLVPARGSSESAARTLGVDTAFAVIKAGPRSEQERRVLRTVRAADLTTSPFPAGGGQVLPVHIVDQFGVEHVVRAGNHLNPKCLAWGRATYVPQHGDSGAGVFVVRKTPEGELRPVLIGNVSQTDDRGGIASLTHRSAPWVGHALDPKPSTTAPSPIGDCTSRP